MSDIRQAFCRDREQDDDDRSPTESNSSAPRTGDYSGDGYELGASLFALSVLSGEKGAVDWAASFVRRNAPTKVSRQRTAKLGANSSRVLARMWCFFCESSPAPAATGCKDSLNYYNIDSAENIQVRQTDL